MMFGETFGTGQPVIGMVHLPPLPGTPQSTASAAETMERVIGRATADAAALERGGVDGLLIENFGDAPFAPDDVPKHTVAATTRAATAVANGTDLPIGINVLRNDAAAAVSIAAATGAEFVRINVHTGARVTDQGIIEGRAHRTLRLRDQLDADVGVFADVDVKHSAPVSDADDLESVADTVERGLADAVIASGRGTGESLAESALREVVAARDDAGVDAPVIVGSGVTADSIGDVLELADGAIVGTALKENGETTAPVDAERVAALVDRADEVR